MDNRDFKGIWIPKEIWLDSRLSALEKIILAEVDSLDNGETGCFASNKYLAEFCQCSERKASEAISKLISTGYLYVESFDGRQRVLRGRLAETARQTSKNCEAGSQNLLPINIDNNILNKDMKERKNSYTEAINNYTDDAKLKEAIVEFIKMRKLIKSPMTDRALKGLLNKLDGLAKDNKEKIAILNQSIENDWKGVYPLKKQSNVIGKSKTGYAPASENNNSFTVERLEKLVKNFGG